MAGSESLISSAGGALLIDTARVCGLAAGLSAALTELRFRDLHAASGIVTVSRSVVEVDPKFHPDGQRFVVKPYPKGRLSRRFMLSPVVVSALVQHAEDRRLGRDDLLLAFNFFTEPEPKRPVLVDADELGLTSPNDRGRTCRHGSLSAYAAGRCRCVHCRRAFAEYRAQRRSNGMDEPRALRVRDSDGHLPAQWFRTNVWKPSCLAAGIDPPVRIHDLRHSHASWLLAGGAKLDVVRDRLGHRSVATTEKYVHTLRNADETALAALDRVRGRSKPNAG